MNKEAARPLKEQIYAVQQIYALRVRRFELNPYWSITLNDQFVSHPAPGLALNYYITNVLAVGINGNYYRPFNADSDFNSQMRRAARVGVPLTEYHWSAALNFTYVPAYGKFAGFGDFIFHYDAYVVGGVGAISTRPIAVIDPDNRNFEYEPKLAFNAGIGLRIFFNRWFAAILEVRDYIFNEKLENLRAVTTSCGNRRSTDAEQDLWTDETRITNNVQAQLGVSIFMPFSFDYRLPNDERRARGDDGHHDHDHEEGNPAAAARRARRRASRCSRSRPKRSAQEIQLTGPLAGAPAVRKLRLYREGRFEVAPPSPSRCSTSTSARSSSACG